MAEGHGMALFLATKNSRRMTAEASTVGVGGSGRQQGGAMERARRRTMSGLYAELGALLPDLGARSSQAQIVQEAITYVRALRDRANELEVHRAMAGSRTSSIAPRDHGAVVVASSEQTSCFAVRLRSARPGALTRVFEVFHRHGVAILAATVVRNEGETAVTVTTAAVDPFVGETIRADIIRSFES